MSTKFEIDYKTKRKGFLERNVYFFHNSESLAVGIQFTPMEELRARKYYLFTNFLNILLPNNFPHVFWNSKDHKRTYMRRVNGIGIDIDNNSKPYKTVLKDFVNNIKQYFDIEDYEMHQYFDTIGDNNFLKTSENNLVYVDKVNPELFMKLNLQKFMIFVYHQDEYKRNYLLQLYEELKKLIAT